MNYDREEAARQQAAMEDVIRMRDLRRPARCRPKTCSLGVGCEEAGTCYAVAHNQPDQCGAQ